jgi:hypothetical protein
MSADSALVRVSNTGVVTAVGNGAALVTASTTGKQPVSGSAMVRGMRKLGDSGFPNECMLGVAELTDWRLNPASAGGTIFATFDATSLGVAIYHDQEQDRSGALFSEWWGTLRAGGNHWHPGLPRECSEASEFGEGPASPSASIRFEGFELWDAGTSTWRGCRLYPENHGRVYRQCLVDPE